MMRAQFEGFLIREWQRRSGWQLLLQPFAWLFAVLTSSRRLLYRLKFLKSTPSTVPVIVVGNISVGGTGKTPLVIALGSALLAQGRHVGMVTRGYAPHRSVSDEVALMSRRSAAPVVANARRVAAVEQLLARYPATNIVISDDGLQHYALGRDIEIAVVDGTRGFGNGYLLPAGPLRENLARLRSVDCIVVNDTNINPSIGGVFKAKVAEEPLPGLRLHNEKTVLAHNLMYLLAATGKPVFHMTYGHESFSPLMQHQNLGVEPFHFLVRGKRVAAVAGIGHPERFFTHLETLGITLDSRHAFPDHHPFVASDLDAIDADLILMTEKDAVKCAHLMLLSAHRVWQMHIDALLPEPFYEFIVAQLEKISHVA